MESWNPQHWYIGILYCKYTVPWSVPVLQCNTYMYRYSSTHVYGTDQYCNIAIARNNNSTGMFRVFETKLIIILTDILILNVIAI